MGARGRFWAPTAIDEASKALLWFEKSVGDVKIVVLARIFKPTQLITLEIWKIVPIPDDAARVRPGAMTTRAYLNYPQNDPQCVQTITIRRLPGTDPTQFNPSAYSVQGGPLRLQFRDLFLRDPENTVSLSARTC
ncbi:hypothetical protein V8E54_006501 [Elaphomyces granulatus]